MKQLLIISCLLLIISFVNCAKLPSGIQLCRISDSPCLKATAQKFIPLLAKGMPEFGIPVFDPLIIGEIKNNNGILNFNFTDARIIGLTSGVVNDISFDTKKKRISFSFLNTGHMDANYIANGRLLILPVVGNGKSYFKTFDMNYLFKISYDIVKGNDGKDYIKILKHKVTYAPKNVEFRFTNLFDGSKTLSDTIHRFGNENWKELFPELGKPFMLKITSLIVETMGKVFSKIPMEELFLK